MNRTIERMLAGFMAMYANSHSKKGGYTLYDFALHEEEPALDFHNAKKGWL